MLFRTTGHRVGAPRASVAMSVAAALMVIGGGTAMGQSPSVEQVSQAEIDAAMTTPTTLTFWTWVPNIEKEVALFEAAYPAIDVKVVNVGQGRPHYTQLRTALQAGTGRPRRGTDGVPVHPGVHHHQQPGRPEALRSRGAQG